MPRFSPVVVDHFTNPRNAGEVENADVRAFIGNPVCGDQILLTAQVQDDIVIDIRFRAYGCAASLAVASMITTVAQGRPLQALEDVDALAVEQLAGGLSPDQRHVAALGADVTRRLITNFRQGIHDDDPMSCAS